MVAIVFHSWRLSAVGAADLTGGVPSSNIASSIDGLLTIQLARQFSTTLTRDPTCAADSLAAQLRTQMPEAQVSAFNNALLDIARNLQVEAESSPEGEWQRSSELFRVCAECYLAGGANSPKFIEFAADSFVVAGDLKRGNGAESPAANCCGRAVLAYGQALNLLAGLGSEGGDMARRLARKRDTILLLIEVPNESAPKATTPEIEA